MILDERTFGDSPAAIDMAKIINETGLSPRKPARLLNRFNKIIMDLNHVDLTTSIHVMELVYRESLEKCGDFEKPLDSYTKNILSTTYKVWAKRKNTLQPKKNRKL